MKNKKDDYDDGIVLKLNEKPKKRYIEKTQATNLTSNSTINNNRVRYR